MRTLLALGALGLSALGWGQTAEERVTSSILYDLSAKRLVTGATYDVGLTLSDFAGVRGFDLQVKPLAGLTNLGTPTAGGVVAYRWRRFSKPLFLELGFGGRVASGERPHGTLYLGFGLNR